VIAAVQNLQVLKVVAVAAVCVLPQGLPAKLTLQEFSWQGEEDLSSTTVPDVAHLTAMQRLRLECIGTVKQLRPSLLLQMQQLRFLQLSCFVMAMPALLGALRGMQQLQHLDLSFANNTQPLEGTDAQQYSAFTASSQLTHLRIAADLPLALKGGLVTLYWVRCSRCFQKASSCCT
jgi:hypothetical protein